MPALAAVLVLLVPIAIGGAVLVALRRRGLALRPVRPVRDPMCPGCRYRLAGVPGPTCPECGRDLAARGVVDRADPPRTVLAAARGLLLGGVLMLWVPLTSAALDAVRPSTWKWKIEADVRVSPGAERCTVSRTAFARAWRRPGSEDFGPARIEVRRGGGRGRLLLREEASALAGAEPAAVAARMETAATAGVPTPSLEAVAAVAVALAGDGPAAGRAPTAAELAAAAGAVTGDASARIASVDDVVGDWRPHAWWPTAAGGLGGAAIAGIVLVRIVRGHRRGAPVPWSGDRGAVAPAATDAAAESIS